jgi:hypothetical protein
MTDDDLTAEALAADPDAPLADDAESFWAVTEAGGATDAPRMLPEWYMPAPMAGAPPLHGWRRQVVFLVIAAFLTITAAGLCNTYGDLRLG